MIDRVERMKEAAEFNSKGDCYVHIEMKGGKNCQIVMAGDGVAIIHGACGLINRLGVLSGQSFNESLESIEDYYNTINGEEVTEIKGRTK